MHSWIWRFWFWYLIDQKITQNIYENSWFFYFSDKTLTGAKPLCNMFDKVNGFFRFYDKTKYLILFWLEKCDEYIGVKSGITCFFP